MTVKILSGGAAALSTPEKTSEPAVKAEGEYLPEETKRPVVVEPQTESEFQPRRGVRRARRERIGFFTVLLIQLVACGALFAGAWAAVSLAPSETAAVIREVIGKFA